MKTTNIFKAWKSTALAVLLLALLSLGVAYEKVSTEALIVLGPAVLALFPSDIFKEKKTNESTDTEEA